MLFSQVAARLAETVPEVTNKWVSQSAQTEAQKTIVLTIPNQSAGGSKEQRAKSETGKATADWLAQDN